MSEHEDYLPEWTPKPLPIEEGDLRSNFRELGIKVGNASLEAAGH
jgi:hypothetical protein